MAQQAHEKYQTQFTKTGTINMKNRKPYRTPAQKLVAKQKAARSEDGAWRSLAPVSYHK